MIANTMLYEQLNDSYDLFKLDILNIIQVNVTEVSQDTVSFLKSRPWWNTSYLVFQTYIEKMYEGTHIVSTPDIVGIYSIFKINTLHIPNQNTCIIKMDTSMCHNNCGKLYFHDQSNRVFTGYALSADGLWRHHSWILSKNNVIIETTESRLIYLGYDSTSEYDEILNTLTY
jgi:hypothetical protein